MKLVNMETDHNRNYTFAVISLGYLGDTILIEPLLKNIKLNFPNSKTVVITNSIFQDVIKGFDSVDEIFGFDKHKGIFGYINFLKEFNFKNKIDFAIITHPHERSLILAKIIKSENIISLPIKNSILNCLINIKIKYDEKEIRNTYKGEYNLKYLSPFCEVQKFPVKYERQDIDYKAVKEKFNLPEHYLVLSPVSKDLVKDWEYENIKDFILNSPLKTVVVGASYINKVSEQLNKDGVNFIDLSNKTNITELGAVIKMSDICVSVDTGTFHLSYSQNVNTIGLFYNEKMIKEWSPKNSNNVKILTGRKYAKGGGEYSLY